eukprot:763630-Hanusia_phi.AAC.5
MIDSIHLNELFGRLHILGQQLQSAESSEEQGLRINARKEHRTQEPVCGKGMSVQGTGGRVRDLSGEGGKRSRSGRKGADGRTGGEGGVFLRRGYNRLTRGKEDYGRGGGALTSAPGSSHLGNRS